MPVELLGLQCFPFCNSLPSSDDNSWPLRFPIIQFVFYGTASILIPIPYRKESWGWRGLMYAPGLVVWSLMKVAEEWHRIQTRSSPDVASGALCTAVWFFLRVLTGDFACVNWEDWNRVQFWNDAGTVQRRPDAQDRAQKSCVRWDQALWCLRALRKWAVCSENVPTKK